MELKEAALVVALSSQDSTKQLAQLHSLISSQPNPAHLQLIAEQVVKLCIQAGPNRTLRLVCYDVLATCSPNMLDTSSLIATINGDLVTDDIQLVQSALKCTSFLQEIDVLSLEYPVRSHHASIRQAAFRALRKLARSLLGVPAFYRVVENALVILLREEAPTVLRECFRLLRPILADADPLLAERIYAPRHSLVQYLQRIFPRLLSCAERLSDSQCAPALAVIAVLAKERGLADTSISDVVERLFLPRLSSLAPDAALGAAAGVVLLRQHGGFDRQAWVEDAATTLTAHLPRADPNGCCQIVGQTLALLPEINPARYVELLGKLFVALPALTLPLQVPLMSRLVGFLLAADADPVCAGLLAGLLKTPRFAELLETTGLWREAFVTSLSSALLSRLHTTNEHTWPLALEFAEKLHSCLTWETSSDYPLDLFVALLHRILFLVHNTEAPQASPALAAPPSPQRETKIGRSPRATLEKLYVFQQATQISEVRSDGTCMSLMYVICAHLPPAMAHDLAPSLFRQIVQRFLGLDPEQLQFAEHARRVRPALAPTSSSHLVPPHLDSALASLHQLVRLDSSLRPRLKEVTTALRMMHRGNAAVLAQVKHAEPAQAATCPPNELIATTPQLPAYDQLFLEVRCAMQAGASSPRPTNQVLSGPSDPFLVEASFLPSAALQLALHFTNITALELPSTRASLFLSGQAAQFAASPEKTLPPTANRLTHPQRLPPLAPGATAAWRLTVAVPELARLALAVRIDAPGFLLLSPPASIGPLDFLRPFALTLAEFQLFWNRLEAGFQLSFLSPAAAVMTALTSGPFLSVKSERYGWNQTQQEAYASLSFQGDPVLALVYQTSAAGEAAGRLELRSSRTAVEALRAAMPAWLLRLHEPIRLQPALAELSDRLLPFPLAVPTEAS